MSCSLVNWVLGAACVFALGVMSLTGQPPASGGGAGQPTAGTNPDEPAILGELRRQGERLQTLAQSELARAFAGGAADLPDPGERTVYRDKAKGVALSEAGFAGLPEAERAGFEKKTYDATFYYCTGYGTPLVYARPLDIVAANGLTSLRGKKVLDFGYGTVGQVRLMAALGAEVHGVDVEPLFTALYCKPGDQGAVRGRGGAEGKIVLHEGRWPAEPALCAKVGGGFDMIVSKNTLKRGYIHPERPVDERRLVKLGVDDPTFVRAAFEALKPGGLFLIYNLAPAQNPEDKPYLPHANGKCPFDRAVLEKAGFQVLKFDQDDADAAHDYWMVLGLNDGQTREQLNESLFAHYTLLKRPGG